MIEKRMNKENMRQIMNTMTWMKEKRKMREKKKGMNRKENLPL